MNEGKISSIAKKLVIAYMILTFVSILMPDEFVLGINGRKGEVDPLQMIIRWFNFASFIVLPIATYFNKPLFKKIAVYFCLPVAIVLMCYFEKMLSGFTSELGTGISDIRYLPDFIADMMHNEVFRGILFFLTLVTQIGTIVLLIVDDKTFLKFKKEDILNFIALILLLIASVVPPYALEGIFNTYTNLIFKAFSLSHFVWLLMMVLEITLLTIIFKRRSYEDRYILVLILALSLLLQFNELFATLGELTCKRMPLQLCNIAAYLILISIITKNRNLFLFNILVNVAGGVIAALVLDVEGKGILYWSNIHYIIEHNNVIIVPLLCLILGIFEPITKKDYKKFVIGFSGYYILIFIIGTLFNSIYKATGSNYFYCNYLFMFDRDTAERLIDFAGMLFELEINIGSVTLYPIGQIVIYLAFLGIGSLTYIILKNAVKKKEVV
ncbi:MAG: YwaF family protein [Bacilli bacterium]|nr:YwaF family protein [Bacilli bacterium]